MNRDLARQLRKNMTDAEQQLWQELRYRQLDGCKFRRQAPIGNYIVDFASFERKLIVELDGGQHAEQETKDAQRTAWLQSQGFTVLRFWNHQVFEELDGVKEVIWTALKASPPPQPSPTRGGGRKPGEGATLPHKGGREKTG